MHRYHRSVLQKLVKNKEMLLKQCFYCWIHDGFIRYPTGISCVDPRRLMMVLFNATETVLQRTDTSVSLSEVKNTFLLL